MLSLLLYVQLVTRAGVVHCSCPEPVSCKFFGRAGTKFSFEGDPYTVPAAGAIEIVSDTHNGCESKPRAFRVIDRETLKGDRFGMWTMRLPEARK